MQPVPQTRASLILRLPKGSDAEAWREFVAIYEPFLYRFARRSGFQDADADELVQNVMLAVVKAVGRWQSDPARARFRTWLFKIARNQFLDLLAKRRRHAARSASSGLFDGLATQSDLSGQLALEHRRELFAWAAARVRKGTKASSWKAFWMTSIENRPVEEVAVALGLSVGAVYIARSRVLARLRSEIQDLESDHAL